MASITFALVLAVVMQSFQKGVFDNLIINVVGYYSGYIQIHSKGYWDEPVLDNCFSFNDSLSNKLGQNPAITAIIPRLETFVLASNGNTTKGCMLVGTAAEQENKLTQLETKLVKGQYLNDQEEAVLVAEGLAKRLNVSVNDTLVLFGQGYHGSMAAGKYNIKGILKLASPQMNDAFVYQPLTATQYFLSAENRLTSLALGISDVGKLEEILESLHQDFGKQYEVMSWKQMMPEIENHIKSDGVSFYIFTGVLYLIIGFGFFGTVMMMTVERKHEFGMLIAIGMKKHKLQLVLFGETLLMTVLGVLFGITISLPLVIYLQKYPIKFSGKMAAAYERFGFEAVFPTTLNVNIFITQALIVFVISILVGVYPLWNIHKLDTIEAMKR
jgi:ABC-type lipoprotein release transport system permease subunit